MREKRSGSQILFGYLPEQTVDLDGKVWKVDHWVNPIVQPIDDTTLREELLRVASPWELAGTDHNFAQDLRRGVSIEVLTLNRDRGVKVKSYPSVWICRVCRRVSRTNEKKCECGTRRWGQLHFVGYHDCGAIREPHIPTCPRHHQAKINFPGTAAATEITITCPICNIELRKGLGRPPCSCGNGQVTFTVHRAARVYTPRSIVIVNPPTPQRLKELTDAGGATRALQWVLGGMKTQSAKELGKTRAAFLQQLLSQGFDPAFAEKTADDAVKAGQVSDDDDGKVELDGQQRVDAEREAVRIAMATLESRLRVQDLVEMVPEGSPLRQLYSENYPRVFHDSGLESVEFIDRFPVLNGNYGYTRGESRPGATRLVSYRHPQSGNPVVYADVAQTEALFVKLDPVKVARWLENRGHKLFKWEDATSARLSILKSAVLPPVGSDPPGINTIGSDLLSLVHSYSHRMIRKTAVLAGLDRNSLSEFLVPLHLGFFVFAAARGGFVLGGLQAMYEAELVPLLEAVVFDEHRCALDPGCLRSGASCAACMHLGEPSCRWFNRFLDRGTLSGAEGYFQFESS